MEAARGASTLLPQLVGQPVAVGKLAAAVVQLDPGQAGRVQHVVGGEAAPVGVGEERHPALLPDPGRAVLDRGEVLAALGQQADADRQHLGLLQLLLGNACGQLAGGDHRHPVVLVGGGVPVVGDRQHVEAGSGVVVDQPLRRRVAVGVGRVRVQLAAQPAAGPREGVGHPVGCGLV